MKKIGKVSLCIFSVFMIHFQFFASVKAEEVKQPIEEVELHSQNAIFINLNDNRILYDKQAKERIYPASMTKIMTTLVAIENIKDFDARCTISEEMLAGLSESNASVAGFKVNESVSYRDLLYGILLPSGADASRAIAFSVFKDENEFITKMNEKADELKMKDTHFVNVSGLHDDQHYSTVYDISQLLKKALQNDMFKEIFCASSYQCENGLTLYSTMRSQAKNNNLDVNFIAGAKTGFTNEASLCLASYAKHNDEEYIMVSAQTNSDSSYPYHIVDAINLYQYIFTHYTRVKIVNEGDKIVALPVRYAAISTYELKAEKAISILVKDGNTKSLKKVFDGKEELEAPVFIKDVVGTFTIYDNDEVVYQDEVYMPDEIDKNLFVYYLSNLDQFIIDFKYIILLFLTACAIFYGYKRNQKAK